MMAMMNKKKSPILFIMILILSCTKELKESERYWNPYTMNEVLVFDGDPINQSAFESQSEHFSDVLMMSIASGERISIRAISSSSNTDANLDYIIYGIK